MKNKISFIVGLAHSGSSITARILNSQNNTINIGEVNNYLKLKKQRASCSCGALINECQFWANLELGDKTLYIRIRDLFRIKDLRNKISRNIAVFNKIADDYTHSGHHIEIIDNSKHRLRAGLLAVSLRRKYKVKIYKTKRSPRSIITSFKNRKGKQNKGTLAQNPHLFYLYYMISLITNVIFNFFMFIFRIEMETVVLERLNSFIENHRSDLDLEIIEKGIYAINDKQHHSIGGSFSSMKSNLRFRQ